MAHGIPVEACDFFAELEYNNDRDWWEANRARWHEVVREPFQALCDALKTAPRGIDPGHPRIALLRHRTLLVSVDHGTPDWLETPAVADRVRADWRSFGPLNTWLATQL